MTSLPDRDVSCSTGVLTKATALMGVLQTLLGANTDPSHYGGSGMRPKHPQEPSVGSQSRSGKPLPLCK